MKYTCKQRDNGLWYVHDRNIYYPATGTKCVIEAKSNTCIYNAKWYQSKIDDCQTMWEAINPDHNRDEWSDIMA